MCVEFSRLRAPFAVPNTTQHRLSPSKIKSIGHFMAEMKLQELKNKTPTDLLTFAESVAVENAYIPFNYIRLDNGKAEGWEESRTRCSQEIWESHRSQDAPPSSGP